MTTLDRAPAEIPQESMATPAAVGVSMPVHQPRKSAGHHVRNLIPPLITFCVFIGVWYLYSWSRFDNAAQRRNALPYPHTVITDGFLPLWDEANGFRPILGYMWPTVKVTLIGLAISIVLGVSLGQAYDGTVLPLAAGFSVLGAAALAAAAWTEKEREA